MIMKIDVEISDEKITLLVKEAIHKQIDKELSKKVVVREVTVPIKSYVDGCYMDKFTDLFGQLCSLNERVLILEKDKAAQPIKEAIRRMAGLREEKRK